MKPQFKSMLFVRTLANGALRIGETFPGRAVEIEDGDGSIGRLIRLMDGSRSITQLHEELVKDYPETTVDVVGECIRELDGLGFLDDRSALERSTLRGNELDRFKANLNFFSYYSTLEQSPWEMQERITTTRVTVIGLGALGSGVLLQLAGCGVKRIRAIDFDTVEPSNLNRQLLYNERDIGRLKVEAAAEFMSRFYSEMELETRVEEIRSADDAKRAIEGSDVVVLAADQPHFSLERWVNRACVELGVPLIGGGVNVIEGQCYTVIPVRTGCMDCNRLKQSRLSEEHDAFIEAVRSSGFRMPSAAIAANYMLLAGMVCSELVKYVTCMAPMMTEGKVISMHFGTFACREAMDFRSREEGCPTCGQGSPEEAADAEDGDLRLLECGL
ncbi:ThiF family adenylyltransferase [Paenibacillus sp. GD4]|uniref:HesA/MoeB/ThiF family protein n=1 Tax=Paenibacillus sp. GD4 TaxID=3068890 RepID=UPI0027963D17|nr:ThiF family adenylyltransferase [Paenibacillus sp. GD4]MDQ1912198.1 ThiF family adenylyltransferase [Paenibacillus sp. GD4]